MKIKLLSRIPGETPFSSKIYAIKALRYATNMGLLEAKTMVENLPAELDVFPPERVEDLRQGFVLEAGDGAIEAGIKERWNNLSPERQTQLLQYLDALHMLG
jgi:hypothetical protein